MEEHLQSWACQADEEDFKLTMAGERNLSPSHSYQFYVSASSRCPEPGEGSQVTGRAPDRQHRGTPVSQLHHGPNLNASMQIARSLRNKQEELETCTRLQVYGLIDTTAT